MSNKKSNRQKRQSKKALQRKAKLKQRKSSHHGEQALSPLPPSLPEISIPNEEVNLTPEQELEIRAIIHQRGVSGMISAIKRVREITDVGLKAAKDYVDSLSPIDDDSLPSDYKISDLGFKDEKITLQPDEEKDVENLLKLGRKIEAIKKVVEQTGGTLRAAKDYVDSFYDKKEDSEDVEQRILGTTTGEFMQLVRIQYDLFDKSQLVKIFSKLRCMEYDSSQQRWVWLYDCEAKKLRFKNSFSDLPAHMRPIVLGSFFIISDNEMYLDVKSIERTTKAIVFFDKYIERTVAEVSDIEIVNKLFKHTSNTPPSPHIFPSHHDFFDKQKATRQDPEEFIKKISKITSSVDNEKEKLELLNDFLLEQGKKPLPEIERFPSHYYEDGIELIESKLKTWQGIAFQHLIGNTDYSFNDYLNEVMQSMDK